MVDQIRTPPVHPRESPSKELEREELIEALKHGNIEEVIRNRPSDVSLKEIIGWLRGQWHRYESQVVKAESNVAVSGQMPTPQEAMGPIEDFQEGAVLSEAELEEMTGMFKGMSMGKGMMSKDANADPHNPKPFSSVDELVGSAEGHISDAESYMNSYMGDIIDAQTALDLKQRMDTLMQEVNSILARVKSGELAPRYALIALAKVNQTKNGAIMTGMLKKAKFNHEEESRITDELFGEDGELLPSPGKIQQNQARSSEVRYENQMLMSQIQKTIQDASSVLENVDGIIGDIDRTKLELIQNVNAR